ncbi:MAG: alpha/beta fold hydrolase [Halobacteriaceae archaeon]
MPHATRADVDLYYETDGDPTTARAPVAFVPDVGRAAWLAAPQFGAVAGPFRAVAYDPRGTGRSDAAVPDDVPTLAADLGAVLAAADAHRPHLVGYGLGGMVALRYARAERVSSLTLLGSAADGSAVTDRLDDRFAPPDDDAAGREALRRALPDGFAAARPETFERLVAWRREDAERPAWTAMAAAMRAFDATDWCHEVTAPVLVLHGTADRVVPAAAGERLARALPRGRFRGVEAGHLAGVERPTAVSDALLGHVEGV